MPLQRHGLARTIAEELPLLQEAGVRLTIKQKSFHRSATLLRVSQCVQQILEGRRKNGWAES